ncbi:MAG: 3-dehydroquinate synthase [Fimbriimonadaceae bacterium]
MIRHRNGSYEVRFVAPDEVISGLPEPTFIFSDHNVFGHYRRFVPKSVPLYEFEPGEGTKTAAGYFDAIQWLASAGAQRDATIVAFGGGVVGDLAGFAAATYMRGVSSVQAPTTLLAQVDSSVGGKCGVDLPEGKNMLGAFYPPTEVRIATGLLATLPPRQFANGMAEVLKYGFIMAPEILEMDAHSDVEAVVRRCVECKREVVEADEFDSTGRRAILNFGHTVGHALEQATGYSELLHGEAISIGMVAEARLSERLGLAPAGTRNTVADVLATAGLPISHPLLASPAVLIGVMQRDKKALQGRLAFSLLHGIGVCDLVTGVPVSEVTSALVP